MPKIVVIDKVLTKLLQKKNSADFLSHIVNSCDSSELAVGLHNGECRWHCNICGMLISLPVKCIVSSTMFHNGRRLWAEREQKEMIWGHTRLIIRQSKVIGRWESLPWRHLLTIHGYDKDRELMHVRVIVLSQIDPYFIQVTCVASTISTYSGVSYHKQSW